MVKRYIFTVSALAIIFIVLSMIYISLYSLPSHNLRLKYNECSGFSRFYSPDEVSFLLPHEVNLPDKLENNTLLGIAFWKYEGEKALFVYYTVGSISRLGCRDYLIMKFTPFHVMKGKNARGVSIMIVIHLYNSTSEANEVFRNESSRLLKYGYKSMLVKGYVAIYRDGMFKDYGEYSEVDSPTRVIIKLDNSIIVIYSIYKFNTIKNYLNYLIS